MGCGATGAFDMFGRLIFWVSRIDWFQRFSVSCFIVVQNYSVIELSNWLYDPGSLNRRDWIDAEIPVVRIFIPKVIFRFNIGVFSLKYVKEFFNDTKNFVTVKSFANPDNKTLNLLCFY